MSPEFPPRNSSRSGIPPEFLYLFAPWMLFEIFFFLTYQGFRYVASEHKFDVAQFADTPRRLQMDHRLWSVSVTVLSLLAVSLVIAALGWFFASPKDLQAIDQLRGAADVARQLVVLSIFVGVASMTVVQMRKYIFRTRGHFHLEQLENRFGSIIFNLPNFKGPGLVARLDTPLEQIMAQIGAFAEQAMLKPKDHREFLSKIGGSPAIDAINRIETSPAELDSPMMRDAYGALRQSIDQGVDSLQITIGARWRYRIRIEASVIAGLMGLVALAFADVGPAAKTVVIMTALVWGGFFACLSRDVVAVIERWRR